MATSIEGELEAWLGVRGCHVAHFPEKGRCLIASRAFSPGEIILEQEAYEAVLDESSQKTTCDSCFESKSTLKRCSRCKFVFYCSTECQRKQWKVHTVECEALVTSEKQNRTRPPPTLRLALRIWTKKWLQENSLSVDSMEAVNLLPSHMSLFPEEKLVLNAQMATLISAMKPPGDPNIRSITELLCRLACNAHTICDEELRPMGMGMFQMISVANHSCHPNSGVLFRGRTAVLRALEYIEPGTEVAFSYADVAVSTASRRRHLADHYFFTCNCGRCTQQGSGKGEQEDTRMEGYCCTNRQCEGIMESRGELFQCLECGERRWRKAVEKEEKGAKEKWEQAKILQKDCPEKTVFIRSLLEVTETEQEGVLHKGSVALMRTRDALVKVCLEQQDWSAALKFCRKTIFTYEGAYPAMSALLGLQYFTLGKLEWYVGNNERALIAFRKAFRILAVTHGRDHRLVRELYRQIEEAEREASVNHENRLTAPGI